MRHLQLRFALDAIDNLDYLARLHGRDTLRESEPTRASADAVRWVIRLAGGSRDLADEHAPLIAEAMAQATAPYLRVANGTATDADRALDGSQALPRTAAYAALFADLDAEQVTR